MPERLPYRFRLDHAIEAWRNSLRHHRTFTADDLDELEQHLRDQVAALQAEGLDEAAAYRQALREMGGLADAETEYRKVYWAKRRRRGEMLPALKRRIDMYRMYVRMALRALQRRKGYSALNIGGLALGLACCILIFLYVQHERGFDRFHTAADAIHRVNWDYNWNDSEGIGSGTPPPLAATFTEALPEVSSATRLYAVSRMVVRHGEAFFKEDRIVGADPNFFAFFDFPLLAGQPELALAEPNAVVLTESTARRYFGSASPLGRALTIGTEKQAFGRTYQPAYRVTGVVADPPDQSHIQFDLLTSMASHPEVAFFDWSWVWMQVTTYVQLAPGTAASALAPKVRDLVARHAPEAFDRVGFSYADLMARGGRWDFVFQPLSDVYLGSANIGNHLGPVGNRTYVDLLTAIALLVLLIACINYTNLATARSALRAREVGVCKVMGAPRRSLIAQFMAESVVISLLALPLALGAVALVLGPFNRLTGTTLALTPSLQLMAVLLALVVLTGLGAGAYPGLYLSAFQPIQVFRRADASGRRGRRLRDGLVVGQFALTIALIAMTLGIRQQMDYLRHADLGFDREGLVVISNENHPLGEQAEAFKEQLLRHPGVRSASLTTGIPPAYGFQDYYMVEGRGETQYDLISYMTDDDFAATLGLELVAGRGFSEDRPADARAVILNETAVAAFGLDDPLGKVITYPSRGDYQVIGVMKDFNFLTLRSPITPFALFHTSSASYQIPDSYVVVRLSGSDVAGTLQHLATQWGAFVTGVPFAYQFLDEGFAAQYENDQRLVRLFTLFSLLTICIACLGLVGLAAFAAEQRTREIGIRKVMGAGVPGLVARLTGDFVRLVLVAFVVGTPLAYLVLSRWLDGFAFRIGTPWLVFAAAGGIALAVALATVTFQALRAARADPAESLRHV